MVSAPLLVVDVGSGFSFPQVQPPAATTSKSTAKPTRCTVSRVRRAVTRKSLPGGVWPGAACEREKAGAVAFHRRRDKGLALARERADNVRCTTGGGHLRTVPAILEVAISVTAGCSSSPDTSPSPNTSPPPPSGQAIDASVAKERRACKSSEVNSLVADFSRAFNAGDLARLDRLFAPAESFQWYSTTGPGERLDPEASDRQTLVQYNEESSSSIRHAEPRAPVRPPPDYEPRLGPRALRPRRPLHRRLPLPGDGPVADGDARRRPGATWYPHGWAACSRAAHGRVIVPNPAIDQEAFVAPLQRRRRGSMRLWSYPTRSWHFTLSSSRTIAFHGASPSACPRRKPGGARPTRRCSCAPPCLRAWWCLPPS